MFENLRWRIAAWFIFLTSIAFAILVTVAAHLFNDGLTRNMDEQLQQLAVDVDQNVVQGQHSLSMKTGNLKKDSDPYLLLTSVQLYDISGHLLQQYGRNSSVGLSLNQKEIELPGYLRERCLVAPIVRNGATAGYLQLKYPTRNRNGAVNQFIQVMALISPVLLLALGVFAYVFERVTTRPLEQTFARMQTFVADAGHELKTPVSVMQSTIENVMRKRSDDEWLTKRVDVLTRSLDRMSHLVQDIITLSDLESRQLLVIRKEIHIDQCIRDVVEEMQELFDQKPVVLLMKEMQPTIILGDPDAIQRVISNLLSNALRYTDAGGKVTVSAIQVGKAVRITVSDTGIGMSPQAVAHIFDRFYRADRSRSRALGGSGLGLSIVKSIVTGHQGAIEVKSEPMKGSEFTVILPAS